MGWWLSLKADGREVEHISLPYSSACEARVLEEVFPDTHWSVENPEAAESPEDGRDGLDGTRGPPPFDFLDNEAKAIEAMRDYDDLVTNEGAHAPGERQFAFAREFWKLYNLGLILQRAGMTPRVSIG